MQSFLKSTSYTFDIGRHHNILEIDKRIRTLIENGITLNHRSLFVIVGDEGRYQVPILFEIQEKQKFCVKANVLWCYKSNLGFSTDTRFSANEKDLKGRDYNFCNYDAFRKFQERVRIEYCYYKDTQRILGRTYDICVLQDFEALTPNILARTIETVVGGGLVIFLLKTMSSLKQLFNLCMDIHSRYTSQENVNFVSRFNERFLLSLTSCKSCLVTDGSLRVLPITNFEICKVPKFDEITSDLNFLKDSFTDSKLISCLIDLCKTVDQAKALLVFLDCISEKSLKYTISLTAARGRGKSAAMGLAVAGAIAFNYNNIIVTSPEPNNLCTFFEFILKGFDALGYKEHIDYGLVRSSEPKHNKALIRVNIFKNNRQTIMYVNPIELTKIYHAEIVVVDEAAAIPIRYIKNMFGPYLLFLSSTTNGYEGTGRSLSGKLIKELRQQSRGELPDDKLYCIKRELKEISLDESIRYSPEDSVESWLNNLLCLYCCSDTYTLTYLPPPEECQLYYINKDTLFSGHKSSELFLYKLMSLYISSHYKNSPNDLQLMSDGPFHHLFCLLGPIHKRNEGIPDIYCFILVCFEGGSTNSFIENKLFKGPQSIGNLMPYIMLEHFNNEDFAKMSGLRIVNISTYPSCQRMGYGSRAMSLLASYFNKEFPVRESLETIPKNTDNLEQNSTNLNKEIIQPRSNLPPLLQTVNERVPEEIDYIGVYYGLNIEVLSFMQKAGYTPVYIGQTKSYLTEEYDCLMFKVTNVSSEKPWLPLHYRDFKKRFVNLLSFNWRELSTALVVKMLMNKDNNQAKLTKEELNIHFSTADMVRLNTYFRTLNDYTVILDILPRLLKIAIEYQFDEIDRYFIQYAITCGIILQCKPFENVIKELQLERDQTQGLFNRCCKRIGSKIDKLMLSEENSNNESDEDSEEEKEDFEKLPPTPLQVAKAQRDKVWAEAFKDTKIPPKVVSIKRIQTKEMARVKKSYTNLALNYKKQHKKEEEVSVEKHIDFLTHKYKIPKYQLKGEIPTNIMTAAELEHSREANRRRKAKRK